MSGAIIISHIERVLEKKESSNEGGRHNPVCITCMNSNIEKGFWRERMAGCSWRNCPMFEDTTSVASIVHVKRGAGED